MSDRNDEAPEEPMLFGIPLSMFPKVPALEERKPTLWERLKLGWWPDLPPLYYTPPCEREKSRG
jgi:hypothetical protein